MSKTTPRPAKHLSARAKALWTDVMKDFELEPAQVELLRSACDLLTTADGARAEIEKHGMAVNDRFDQLRPNPFLEVERQALTCFTRTIRELGLSSEPADSRPPLGANYR